MTVNDLSGVTLIIRHLQIFCGCLFFARQVLGKMSINHSIAIKILWCNFKSIIFVEHGQLNDATHSQKNLLFANACFVGILGECPAG